MGILDQMGITGMKPVEKNRPTLDRLVFDKTKPLGPHNFPVYSYAKYRIYGYKRDAAGMRHPVSWEETLPCGQRIRFNKADYPGIEITRCERAVSGPRLF